MWIVDYDDDLGDEIERVIYQVFENKITVKVVRITAKHDYSKGDE